MKIAEYIKGAKTISQIPSDAPIVLLMGRSNVGKSSLINSLTNRKNLAHTSGNPGKTIILNFYQINNSFYIVDAPGYGYAKRSKSLQDEFIVMIEEMLTKHPKIAYVLLVIDFKIGPTDLDLATYEFLNTLDLEVIVVATKKDKIPKTKQYKQEKIIKASLNNPSKFYTISNVNRENIDLLRNHILEGVKNYESS